MIAIATTQFRIICYVLVLTLGSCSYDRPLRIDSSVDTLISDIKSSTPELMQQHNIIGLSVSIIRNSKLQTVQSFGFRNTRLHSPLNDDTVFRAASLGKPVFAYIVHYLSQHKLIDLDTPVISYFNKRVVADDPRSDTITARMLLSHTSGLPNLDKKIIDISFDPGSNFKYSGYGYLYLQQVIEKITGKSLETLASEIVFKPLNMNSSSFSWKADYSTVISSSYDKNAHQIAHGTFPDKGFSAWSLFTTVHDYSRFIIHLLTTANTTGSPASIMLAPVINITNDISWSSGVGLQNTRPNVSFWHWGSLEGFRHFFVAYPEENIAVLVLSNSASTFEIVDDIMIKSIGGNYPAYDWF